MNKGLFIEDIVNNASVKGVFCVSSKKEGVTRAGKPYLALRLLDRSGEIEGRVWDNAEVVGGLFDKGNYVQVLGRGSEYNGEVQLNISMLEKVDESSVDLSKFIPSSSISLDEYCEELKSIISSVKRKVLRDILNYLFQQADFVDLYISAPAAKNMHHAYLRGLLEHSVGVARLADSVCVLYQSLDRDLLVTAALCHDIGKVDELSFTSLPFDYTDRGRLIGHITLGILRIETVVEKAGIDPQHSDVMLLKHLLLSHHGEKEFGSPVLPMTMEAFALHMVDNFDAKINAIARLKAEEKKGDWNWTEYQRIFGRYFYLRSQEED